MPKVSVIVPVYCAEDFLQKCVESVLTQTLEDIELILVDDGSPDKSGELCDQIAAGDTRVRVCHQPNAGVSSARNKGIEIASGEYFAFVDADDWIDKEMYERLYVTARDSNADVVMCDATTVYSDGKTQADTITRLSGSTTLKKSDFSAYLLMEMAGSAWRCIYKNAKISGSLPGKMELRFPIGIKFSEDRIFNLYAFGQANKVVYLKESYYFRYVNMNSAVHSFHPDYFRIVKQAHFGIMEAVEKVWNDDPEVRCAYLGQFIGGAFAAVNNYFYKTCPWGMRRRLESVSMLCKDQVLRNAIAESKNTSNRAKWILKNNTIMLSLYSILANIKNGR